LIRLTAWHLLVGWVPIYFRFKRLLTLLLSFQLFLPGRDAADIGRKDRRLSARMR